MPEIETRALELLQTVFGYSAFRDPQADIIQHLSHGGDAMVLMPTGGGKSLCYQIPALLRPGTGVVISPLIALMQDQVMALRQFGVRAAYLNSSLPADEAADTERQLLEGELDMLYIAPERLLGGRMLQQLSQLRIALFAIDEAHCVSQWGHDFRPEYSRLSVLHEHFPQVPRIALTATADSATRKEMIERLGLQQARIFNNGFDRPNIRYRISEQQRNARQELLHFIQTEHPGQAGIVYCLSRKKVDDTAHWLSQNNLKALPYHAGMPATQRQHNQQRFLREDDLIIVATIAFGMGIDKPDVRFVAHLSLPKSIEAYYQETGRAGRDGTPANAWMHYGLQDVITLRQMQQQSQAPEHIKRIERQKLDAMLGLCEITSCRRQSLLHYFDETMDEPCGNCDNCLDPPKTWDATISARKALSCVYRSGQRFGVNHLIDVLRGSQQDRIHQLGHDQISTYGIGKEHKVEEWRSIYRQLIARGLLRVDMEGHGSLLLTEAARPLLRGNTNLYLRKARRQDSRVRQNSHALDHHRDDPLWEALRRCRRDLAEEQEIPAYRVFHDATLLEMLEKRPVNMEEMAAIGGVGARKLEAYGSIFLDVLN